MSYTTIIDLDEKLVNDLIGTEYLLITDPDNSYKVSLDTLNDRLVELSSGTYAELTNKVIDSVTNFVHANAIHFIATAVGDIPKGAAIKLVQSDVIDAVFVTMATSNNDTIIGLCEDGMVDGQIGEVMVMGILKGVDVSPFTEGDMLYYQFGVLTNAPDTKEKSQVIGYVLDANAAGRILVTNTSSNVIAKNIGYDNSNGTLNATDVQSAIDELADRTVITTPRLVIMNNEITLPYKAISGIFNGIAFVYKTPNAPNVITEYTCVINNDGSKVLFESIDSLNGFECTVVYFAAV